MGNVLCPLKWMLVSSARRWVIDCRQWDKGFRAGLFSHVQAINSGRNSKDIARSSGTQAGSKSADKGSEDSLRRLVDLFRLIPRPTEKGRVLISKMAQS